LRAGDFMVWVPLTPQWSLPPLDPQKTRLSLQVLVRPAKDAAATRMTDWFSFLKPVIGRSPSWRMEDGVA
jgi:hypothetical protein